jgi:multiple sugar transport system permease protein
MSASTDVAAARDSDRHERPIRPGGSARLRVENAALRIARWVTILLVVVVSAGPIVYGIAMSLRTLPDVMNNPLNIFPAPSELNFSAWTSAFRSEENGGFGLARFMLNSLIVAAGTVGISIAFSVLGAYAAVRLRFLGRNVANAMFLMVYLFPGIVLAVPLFAIFSRIGLRGELLGLIIIYLAQTVPVSIWMLRNYFLSVPESIEEAAKIDGCSRMEIIVRIVLPLALPGIISTALYVFMIAWNEYLYALLFMVDNRANWTISLGLAQLQDFAVPPTVLMAGSMAMTIPIVIIFVLAQKSLVEGLTAGSDK